MLRSTFFRLDTELEEKVKSMDKTVTLYAKSKKRDRIGEAGLVGVQSGLASTLTSSDNLHPPSLLTTTNKKNWKAVMVSLYPNLTLMLEEVLQSDVPKYFKVAALDLLVFILKYHDFLSRATAITCFSILVNNLLIVRERHSFDWKSASFKSSNFGSMLSSLKTLAAENVRANKYLKDFSVELKGLEDPYLDCVPALMGNIMTFFMNFNNMLPSLAAGILHKAAQLLIQQDSVFCFELPSKVLLLICKLMEKTIIICQADLKIPIGFISNLIVCQTVLNNPNYRMKVEKSFSEHDEVHLTAKETLALYIHYLSQNESLEELISGFGTLWETLKTKYIFLMSVPELKHMMLHMSTRLRELALELEGQVLTDEFSEFDSIPQRVSEGIQDLKFEKIEAKTDSPLLISSKDIIKTKIEYLKNFRDIFGEFEYYLELIDCISANLGEKLSCQKEHRNNGQDNGLDFVSKKLVAHFAASGLQLNNCLDPNLWELVQEVQNRVCEFLLVFLNDSVFIDYFQSTWVILCNMLVISEETREKKLNAALLLLLQASEVKHFGAKGVTNLHLVKCIQYVLDYTTKNLVIKYDKAVNELLMKLFHRVVKQIRHTQNTDLIRLLRFLLGKYPDELNEDTAITFAGSFLDKNFDIDSEGATKLMEQYFDIVCRRPDRDSILANLLGMVLETSKNLTLAHKNYEQRQQILGRRLKQKTPSIKAKLLNSELRDESMRKVKVLGLIFDRLDSKVIVQLCKLKKSSQDLFPDEDKEDNQEQSSLFSYLSVCVQLAEESLTLMIIRLLQNILGRVKSSVQYVNKGCLTVCSFVFRLLLQISASDELGAETHHELLTTSLIIFSSHLPSASFDQELELYLSLESQQAQKNILAPPGRNPDICCFESLREHMKETNGSKISLNDVNYVNVRLYEFMRLYMAIKKWVESPWSSIKSLFCNLVGFAVPCTIMILEETILEPLKAEMSDLLEHLLDSKESESVINGLNIMGALCGFGSDLSKTKVAISEMLHFFKRNSSIIPISVWEKVFVFQESWDITIQIASILMLQITLPNEYAKYIYRKRKQRVKMQAKEGYKSTKPSNGFSALNQSKVHSGNLGLAMDKEVSVISQPLDTSTMQASNGVTNHLSNHLGGEHPKFVTRLDDEKVGLTGASTQQFTTSNNHSVTGLSGDQLFEDEMNGNGLEGGWLDKVFQEEELRQLLNLFKMHFNKDENKWAKFSVIDKNMEYTFDREAKGASNSYHPKLAADEMDIQSGLGGTAPNQEETSHNKSEVPNVNINGHQNNTQETSAAMESRGTYLDFVSQKAPETHQMTADPSVGGNQDHAALSPKQNGVEKDHPVKKIIKMKNKLLQGLTDFEKSHGVQERSASHDANAGLEKHHSDANLHKMVKTMVTSQSQKGLPTKPAPRTVNPTEQPRPRATTPGAPRSQLLAGESANPLSPGGFVSNPASAGNSTLQGNSVARKSTTRKEISRVLSSQLMKHPTEGTSTNSSKTMASPKNLAGLDHAYIKSLLKPVQMNGGVLPRSSSTKRVNPDKSKEKPGLLVPLTDYQHAEEEKKSNTQLGNSLHSDRLSTTEFLNLKKRVIARAEAQSAKQLFSETGLLSGFSGNLHPHISGLGLHKPTLQQTAVLSGNDTSSMNMGGSSSSKTKLLVKPSGKVPSLLTAFKEQSPATGLQSRHTTASFPTPESM